MSDDDVNPDNDPKVTKVYMFAGLKLETTDAAIVVNLSRG